MLVMKTPNTVEKQTADGQPITSDKIKSWNESYQMWGCNAQRYISDEGEAGLANMTYQARKCGCEVTGNGTIQFPLTVKPCAKTRLIP